MKDRIEWKKNILFYFKSLKVFVVLLLLYISEEYRLENKLMIGLGNVQSVMN